MSVTPIKPEIEPQIDVEREMRAYVETKLREYFTTHGEPMSIAFVLVGQDRVGSMTEAYSWSPKNDEASRLHTCAVASTVLMKRALGL